MADDKDKDNKKADEPAAPETQVEQAEVAFYYVDTENPTGATYPGVPPGDILKHVYDMQPDWIRKGIAHNPMYSTDPPGKKKPDKAKESEK